ncbi:MAG: hypothetical protein JWN08_784 [Frankiales bacterium]|nr:hypothetical protein [Frankiales bacterium]
MVVGRPPGLLRVLVDGVGGSAVADALVPGLAAAGREPLRVHAEDFWRPAGERFEWGREDGQAFREHWLDAGALQREVLSRDDAYLPALWDVAQDRSARRAREPLGERSVLLVDGVLLLDRGLSADVVVHVALSPAALRRRGVPEWQVPVFAAYDAQVRPTEVCDVLVRAEDPLRPAVLVRTG